MLLRLSPSCVALLLLSANIALAESVVFDNGAGGAMGVSSALVSDLSSESTPSSFPIIIGDDFILDSQNSITGVKWTGVYAFQNTPPLKNDFTIEIYADDGGIPPAGSPLAHFDIGDEVSRVHSGEELVVIGNAVLDVFEFTAQIDFEAAANTRYWLAIYDNTLGDQDDFYWTGVAGSGEHIASADSGASWITANGFTADFKLTAVPEPRTVVVLSLLMALAPIRRKKI